MYKSLVKKRTSVSRPSVSKLLCADPFMQVQKLVPMTTKHTLSLSRKPTHTTQSSYTKSFVCPTHNRVSTVVWFATVGYSCVPLFFSFLFFWPLPTTLINLWGLMGTTTWTVNGDAKDTSSFMGGSVFNLSAPSHFLCTTSTQICVFLPSSQPTQPLCPSQFTWLGCIADSSTR